jgi:hypothetical protein
VETDCSCLLPTFFCLVFGNYFLNQNENTLVIVKWSDELMSHTILLRYSVEDNSNIDIGLFHYICQQNDTQYILAPFFNRKYWFWQTVFAGFKNQNLGPIKGLWAQT